MTGVNRPSDSPARARAPALLAGAIWAATQTGLYLAPHAAQALRERIAEALGRAAEIAAHLWLTGVNSRAATGA